MALAVLLVNDHLLKQRWPGAVTGKLSDFAGVFLLPLVIVSVAELLTGFSRHRWIVPSRVTTVVCAIVGAGFVLVKTWRVGSAMYGTAVGDLRWPFTGTTTRVEVVRDPTDLIALLGLVVAWLYAWRSAR